MGPARERRARVVCWWTCADKWARREWAVQAEEGGGRCQRARARRAWVPCGPGEALRACAESGRGTLAGGAGLQRLTEGRGVWGVARGLRQEGAGPDERESVGRAVWGG